MIAELHVLFAVQDLQESRGRISLVVTADLINLIQKHQRIGYTCLTQSVYQTSRHGPNVGLSVAADFRFIMDAAQADAHILFIQGSGYRAGNRRFSRSRRSHQADDRAVALLCQNADRKILQHPLFHLLETIMVLLQDLLCMPDIVVVLRYFIPRKLQQGLDIGADDIALLTTARHTL